MPARTTLPRRRTNCPPEGDFEPALNPWAHAAPARSPATFRFDHAVTREGPHYSSRPAPRLAKSWCRGPGSARWWTGSIAWILPATGLFARPAFNRRKSGNTTLCAGGGWGLLHGAACWYANSFVADPVGISVGFDDRQRALVLRLHAAGITRQRIDDTGVFGRRGSSRSPPIR